MTCFINQPNLSKQKINELLSYNYTRFYNRGNFLSNESIQQAFDDFTNKNIVSSVDYFRGTGFSQCRIYTHPYRLKYYDDITNNLPGGIFRSVRKVSLFDEHPFEHEFFLRLSQSFPLLEGLVVENKKQQQLKRFKTSTNFNEMLSIIKYPHLIELHLLQAHQDYYEQFFFDTKTCLPNDVHIRVDYRIMRKITRNFRRNSTRSNCVNISSVFFANKSNSPEHLHEYFLYVQF